MSLSESTCTKERLWRPFFLARRRFYRYRAALDAVTVALCLEAGTSLLSSIMSNSTNTFGTFSVFTEMSFSHLPSDLILILRPSMQHFTIALYGTGSFSFQITP